MGKIYSYLTCMKMFKPISAKNFVSSRNVYTINIDLIQPVHQRLQKCQRAKSFSGPKEWNCLPNEIRNIQTFGMLKKNRKIYLFVFEDSEYYFQYQILIN